MHFLSVSGLQQDPQTSESIPLKAPPTRLWIHSLLPVPNPATPHSTAYSLSTFLNPSQDPAPVGTQVPRYRSSSVSKKESHKLEL